jgi:hypothetical protein
MKRATAHSRGARLNRAKFWLDRFGLPAVAGWGRGASRRRVWSSWAEVMRAANLRGARSPCRCYHRPALEF